MLGLTEEKEMRCEFVRYECSFDTQLETKIIFRGEKTARYL